MAGSDKKESDWQEKLKGKETEKSCPKCGVAHRLIIRENVGQGTLFLGCGNWPRCNYTEPLPEDIKMQALGQTRLL